MTMKNILITGSTRGIGRAASLHLAGLGYNVAINGVHSKEKLYELKEQLERQSIRVCAFLGDVGIYETARTFYDTACRELGSVDAVINNAGVSYVGLFQDMTPQEWDLLLSTNLTSIYNMCHAAIPDMVRRRSGRIINISSMWGICGASCEAAYAATKGAVNALTRSLGKELAPSGIQVNAIACGAIDTDMNRCFSAQELQDLADEIPAGRLGSPLEAARMIEMLLTAPDYLTGEVIKMDGGYI
jgi:3-oxoacyl-[acyl-carrier protein] reductase